MGWDKGRLAFGVETMLVRVARLVGEVVNDVVIVARDGQDVPAFPEGAPSIRVVRDPVAGLGPLAGIVTGLKAIRHTRAFVTACDMPFVRPALVRRLVGLIGDYEVCLPVSDGHAMTMCAIYRTSVIDEAERLIASGQLSVKGLIERVSARRVDATAFRDLDPDLESFISCDTPEAYQQALVRLKADATSD